jgi:predicted  nucleic acid-binding Zn-ribbon protein
LEIQNARASLLNIQALLIKSIQQLRQMRALDGSTRASYQQVLNQANDAIRHMEQELRTHASAATTHRDEVANIRKLMQVVENFKTTLKTSLAAARPATPAAPPSPGGRRYDYSYNVANWWRSAAMWR